MALAQSYAASRAGRQVTPSAPCKNALDIVHQQSQRVRQFAAVIGDGESRPGHGVEREQLLVWHLQKIGEAQIFH